MVIKRNYQAQLINAKLNNNILPRGILIERFAFCRDECNDPRDNERPPDNDSDNRTDPQRVESK